MKYCWADDSPFSPRKDKLILKGEILSDEDLSCLNVEKLISAGKLEAIEESKPNAKARRKKKKHESQKDDLSRPSKDGGMGGGPREEGTKAEES